MFNDKDDNAFDDEALEMLYGMDVQDVLNEAVSNGILRVDEIAASVERMKRDQLLSQHSREIWQDKNGMFLTYIYDEDGKRKIRRRKTREELEEYLVKHYKTQEDAVYLDDIFKTWSSEKLVYGEIQRQSYDRYKDDYKRFFRKSLPICRKKVKNITEDDLEAFIRTTISELNLTRRAYSGLTILINGMFKYAKKHGFTNISITQFMGDLDISRHAFRTVVHRKECETFSEADTPRVRQYLQSNEDIWNLGLMLMFQTGLRVGEAVALKPSDIGQNVLHVFRTEYKYREEDGSWKLAIKEHTKTDAGCRDIVLPPQAHDTLRKIRALNPNGEYLLMSKGKRIRGNTLNKRISDICEKLGIVHHSSHKIRKTYGTMLLDHDVDDSFVAEQMGHTDVSTTRKLYYYSNRSAKTKQDQIAQAVVF